MKLNKELITSDEIKISYGIARNRKPFLFFVHGLSGNHTGWHCQLDFFKDKGYSVITMDLRGHGKSGVPERKEQFSMEKYAEDIKEVLDKERVKEAVLIGHCFGGMIVQDFYKRYPNRVKSLILIGTTYKNPYERNSSLIHLFEKPIFKLYHFLAFLVKNTFYKKIHYPYMDCYYWSKKPEYIEMIVSTLLYTNALTLLYCQDVMRSFNSEKILKKIKIPLLILAGDRDTTFTKHIHEEMHSLAKNSELSFFNSDHLIILHKPKETNLRILKFLKKYNINKK